MPTQWIEDWFGSEYYCLLYRHRDKEEAAEFLKNLANVLRLQPASRILDAGCGRGRHSIRLAEMGFDVTGIDISERCILETRAAERNNLKFYKHDKRNLLRIRYFDAVLNLFTSFGYFESDRENNKTICSLAASLKSGGWLVLDYMNTEKEIKDLEPEATTEHKGVRFTIRRSASNGSIRKTITIHDKGKELAYAEQVRAYNLADLQDFFLRNGLEVVHLFGNYNLEPFTVSESPRLILIGQKK